ncbi:PLC-like phosphodiesterase [Talaromyces proteolyticus]|uniref:PLC-like phosphodiesterase n=1 Tax=Talaromyces proteolyticus TaxID=1131652 RepID=A0AAD4KV87_9EURO|nr:PLC-like phosphodiesterase [Talaromyces proteolyticus]KAH8700614.1 PLC-like phosphodiesterase [Talaromyces proteolyticus]
MFMQRLALLSAAALAPFAAAQCNGRSEYCDRSYSNITFIGAHDSPFVGSGLSDNQNLNITAQLEFGIRFLQGQTHKNDDGTLDMCHTSCILEDAGSLSDFLGTVKTWLDANPNEVVTLLVTNGDNLAIDDFASSFNSSGIQPYLYIPPTSPDVLPINQWPTLQDLINNGTRAIAFLDYGANMSSVPYILDEFQYYFETPFDVTDPSFSNCSIDRPAGASPDSLMYIVNHFLDVDILGAKVPDRDAAGTTNAASGNGSIGAQAASCDSQYDRLPNVLLVDFTDKGAVIDAQNALNGF